MKTVSLIYIEGTIFFLTPSCSISIDQTNLPDVRFCVRRGKGVYYKIEKLGYDQPTKCLNIKITDYKPSDVSGFEFQKLDTEILKLKFQPLEKKYIEEDLSSFNSGIWQRTDLFIVETDHNHKDYNRASVFAAPKTTYQSFYPETKTEETVELKIKYRDSNFGDGYVSFEHNLGRVVPIMVKIENPNIISEFDNIKAYFPKALGGSQYFTVTAVIIYTDYIISGVKATSAEIDKINSNLIERIKYDRIRKLVLKQSENYESKTLFTVSDIFDDGNIFFQTEQDIIQSLSNDSKIRNRKQLDYLAGAKHSADHKIYFTLRPNFGFLFFIETPNYYHYSWELLNSHATYLWSFAKAAVVKDRSYSIIESEISEIHLNGRDAYVKSCKAKEKEDDFIFDRIEHSKINSTIDDGFHTWKQKFENCLL